MWCEEMLHSVVSYRHNLLYYICKNIRAGKEFRNYLLQFLRSKEGKLHSEQVPPRDYYRSSALAARYAKIDG